MGHYHIGDIRSYTTGQLQDELMRREGEASLGRLIKEINDNRDEITYVTVQEGIEVEGFSVNGGIDPCKEGKEIKLRFNGGA